jgi:hypothetical protein
MNKRMIAIIVSSVFVVQGCAMPPSGEQATTGEQTTSGNLDQVCNPLIIAALAAVACGVIAPGNRRVGAGVVCAAAAGIGCYMVNSYKAQQVRSAQQVEDEYKRANRDLPERAMITAYTSDVNPTAVSRGKEVSVNSVITVVRGRNDPTVNVEEEIGLYDAKGEVWGKPFRKPANSTGQSGEYKTAFTIKTHQDMSQGVYQIRKTAYLNGAAVSSNNRTTFQVVQTPTGFVVAWVR